MTLGEFLLARIAEDETTERHVDHRYVGAGRTREEVSFSPPSARMLADCEAKRRIVALHTGSIQDCVGHEDPTHPACASLRALALPYADHPDYLTEWSP